MSTEPLSQELRRRTDRLWNAIFEHPFVLGIGDGSLDSDKFIFYLKQDFAYLIEYTRIFGLCAAKSTNLTDIEMFSDMQDAILKFEMAHHRKTCASFGIGEDELQAVSPALINQAYTDNLVRTCYEGRIPDILAALIPCVYGYWEIADHLFRKGGLPVTPHLRAWIETYTSNEFKALGDLLNQRLDTLGAELSGEARERLHRYYLMSTRYELLFFEMGWRKEIWPAVVPVD